MNPKLDVVFTSVLLFVVPVAFAQEGGAWVSAEAEAYGSAARAGIHVASETKPVAQQQENLRATYSGTYSGNINGTPATLTLQQQEAKLNGKMEADGYGYNLQGDIVNDIVSGTVKDPQTGGSLNFELTRKNPDEISLTLVASDESTGETQRIPIEFRRGGNRARQESPANPGKDNFERDTSLVGVWATQQVMSSGDASVATQTFFQLNADGTYEYGNSRTVGGGSDWSGDTGSSGETTRGKWRTESRILYLSQGNSQYAPAARYYIEGYKMLLTMQNGSREIWYRQ